MSRAVSRRLDLRIPADHPIFEVPDGERGRIAREWMERGRSQASIETRLQSIEQILLGLDSLRHFQGELKQEGPRFSEPSGLNVKRLEADILQIFG